MRDPDIERKRTHLDGVVWGPVVVSGRWSWNCDFGEQRCDVAASRFHFIPAKSWHWSDESHVPLTVSHAIAFANMFCKAI